MTTMMIRQLLSLSPLLRFFLFSIFLLQSIPYASSSSSSSSFEPYQLNGGLVTGIAGKNYCLMASDTRMMDGGYQIYTRNQMTRLFGLQLPSSLSSSSSIWGTTTTTTTTDATKHCRQTKATTPILPQIDINEDINMILSSSTTTTSSTASSSSQQQKQQQELLVPQSEPVVVLGTAGCQADGNALQRQLLYHLSALQYHQGSSSSCGTGSFAVSLQPSNVAQLLSQTLYSRRSFPYYAFCVVGGLDTTSSSTSAMGQCWAYDAIGSMEQVAVATAGTGRELLQPILDHLFSSDNYNHNYYYKDSKDDDDDDNDNDDETTTRTSTKSTSAATVVTESAEEAIQKVIQAYHAVAEREIGVGDSLVMCLLEAHTETTTTTNATTTSSSSTASTSTTTNHLNEEKKEENENNNDGDGDTKTTTTTRTTTCRMIRVPLKKH